MIESRLFSSSLAVRTSAALTSACSVFLLSLTVLLGCVNDGPPLGGSFAADEWSENTRAKGEAALEPEPIEVLEHDVGPVTVEGIEAADVSFPGFLPVLARLGARVEA